MSREKCHASSLYDCLECKFPECIRSPSSKIPGESPGAMLWLKLTDYAEKYWLCDEYSEDYDRERKNKREKKERNEKIVKAGEETRRARPEKER